MDIPLKPWLVSSVQGMITTKDRRTKMTNKVWRGGMIGAGAWSEVQLTAWAGVRNVQIVALCDRHAERRDPVARRFEIPQVFDDFERMMEEGELDFVDICTRPYSHASLVKLAAQRGLPVLCQKPFCTSLDEAREVDGFCRSAGVRLMINENYRWQAWYRKAKELLAVGALGAPFLAVIHKRDRMTLPDFKHPQTYLAEMPRLIVYEVGVHFLDTFRFLFGEPDTLYARLHRVSSDMKGEDVQMITLGYPGLTGLINTSWASVPVPGLDEPVDDRGALALPRLEIDGTQGTLTLMCDGSLHLVTDNNHMQWHFGEDTTDKSHIAAQKHFIDCMESGTEFETNAAETIKTMSLVFASYLSAKEGKVIDVNRLD
jgi:predicted dehydrogenase